MSNFCDCDDDEYQAYAEQEYYERRWTVTCKECGATATGTEHELKQIGWVLEAGGEFCGAIHTRRLAA